MAADSKAAPAPTPVVVVPRAQFVSPWSKDIAKVRITPGKGRDTVTYGDKTYTQDSEPEAAGDLEALAQASLTGDLVIEKFNKDGVEVNSSGRPLKTISPGAPPQIAKSDLAKAEAKVSESRSSKKEKE